VDEHGDREPDYRFSLANERTLLAWARTALGLEAAGLGVVRFAPPLSGGRELLGAALVALGGLAAWNGYRRFVAVDRAMRAGARLPASPAPLALTASLAALAAVVVLLLVADRLW
jgi:putative membrane protein